MAFKYSFSYRDRIAVNVFENKRLKRTIRWNWDQDSNLNITVPSFFRHEHIEKFINDNSSKLARQYNKLQTLIHIPIYSEEEEKIARKQLKKEATQFYESFPTNLYKSRPDRVQVRAQKTRWGSCSTSGTISLNVYILKLPAALKEYVLLHELVHMEHPNHQKEFWEELERLCPNAKEKAKQLKKYVLPTK